MARPSIRHGIALLMVLAAALLPAMGCQSLAFTLAYLIKGTDVDPEFDGLKGKHVAVVCRPLASLQYSNSNVARDLAGQVTQLLEQQVPKIKIIDQRKIAKWADENRWEEYTEVGKAMKADVVVGIELESFSLYQAQTLYQGKANAVVQVYDCKNGKLLFEKAIPQSVYPPNVPIYTSEMPEPQFRKKFVAVLADQIGRHFYAHDPHADLAQDATALEK
jgi:hypothetical protein